MTATHPGPRILATAAGHRGEPPMQLGSLRKIKRRGIVRLGASRLAVVLQSDL
jgi:hypothetical protein